MPINSSSNVYSFIDGAYLRSIASAAGQQPYDPRQLSIGVLHDAADNIRSIPRISRFFYFDAAPDADSGESDSLGKYWDAVESLDDTHLGFGWIRGQSSKRGPRQKAVDTLLAVEMVSGAYSGRFDAAILIAGDADFVPVVNEVRRAGPHVIVAASHDPSSQARFNCSPELRRAADRFVKLPWPGHNAFSGYFQELKVVSV